MATPSTPSAAGRKPKPRRRFVRFGDFLKGAREAIARSQQKALPILAKAGLNNSQSWLASLEVGAITDPDPDLIQKLSRAYGVSYDQIVYHLIRDKYYLDDLSRVTPLTRERWQTVSNVLNDLGMAGRVKGLEIEQLRAKALMLSEEMLDLEGLARWQKEFPNLKELWLVTPRFQDDRDFALRDAVTHNLARGVDYCYFVRQADVEEGGAFWVFRRRLTQDYPHLRNRVQRQIRGIGLEEPELRWILTDIVIANPTDPATRTGFVGLRREYALHFACRMPDLDAERTAQGIMPFLATKNLVGKR